ncbi:MAG: hypothetical protein ABIG93_02505 [archaeon]|nr:hypothetical protein [Nanoarchaeota archaeon]
MGRVVESLKVLANFNEFGDYFPIISPSIIDKTLREEFPTINEFIESWSSATDAYYNLGALETALMNINFNTDHLKNGDFKVAIGYLNIVILASAQAIYECYDK